jgi:hypothetical protein
MGEQRGDVMTTPINLIVPDRRKTPRRAVSRW